MKIKLFVLALMAAVCVSCSGDKKIEKSDLKTEKQKISYAIGLDIGKNFKRQKMDVDLDYIYQGIRSGYQDSLYLLTDVEIRNIMTEWQKNRSAERDKEKSEIAKKNLEESSRFLEENSRKQGVITSASGLQHIVIKSGNGATPGAKDSVLVNFRGSLLDGTVINDTYKNGSPLKIPVSGLMPGWTEAALQMKEGDHWKLFIPPALAYGDQGRGQRVPANAAIIFEVELLKVAK